LHWAWVVAATLPASIALAALSYYLIERPILNRSRPAARRNPAPRMVRVSRTIPRKIVAPRQVGRRSAPPAGTWRRSVSSARPSETR
jgi:peptidoglycan/LPS O-acetylase OafA/YrhL